MLRACCKHVYMDSRMRAPTRTHQRARTTNNARRSLADPKPRTPPLVWVHDCSKDDHWSAKVSAVDRLRGGMVMYNDLTGAELAEEDMVMPPVVNHPASAKGRLDAGLAPICGAKDLFNCRPLFGKVRRAIEDVCRYRLFHKNVTADEVIFAAAHVATKELGMRVLIVSGDWDFSMIDGGDDGRVRVVTPDFTPRPTRGDDHLRWASIHGKPYGNPNVPPADLPADVFAKMKENEAGISELPQVWKTPAAMHQFLAGYGAATISRVAMNMALINVSPYQKGHVMSAALLRNIEDQSRKELTR